MYPYTFFFCCQMDDLKFLNFEGLSEIEIHDIKNILRYDSKDSIENKNDTKTVEETEIPVEIQNNPNLWYNRKYTTS